MAVRDVVQAAAGVGGDKLYVEDVFSTYLYEGNSATQTITNGIDLAGEGGMVWVKNRTLSVENQLTDTVRGLSKTLDSATNLAQSSRQWIDSVSTDGFTLSGTVSSINNSNGTGYNYVTWSWRKAPKFFDVVTWSGNGVAGREIAHNLGSVPGSIFVKSIDNSWNWQVYHRSTEAGMGPNNYAMLNTTIASTTGSDRWNNTSPTDTVFTVGNATETNGSGSTYVAYLFAHDAGGFGDDGEQNVISCGSYTGNGSATGPVINLGWEPQWVLVRRTSGAGEWLIFDVMRGMSLTDSRYIETLTASEGNIGGPSIVPTATGFQIGIDGSQTSINASSQTYIYIAIRRPMKTPESGTDVFQPVTYTGNNLDRRLVDTGILTDMTMARARTYEPIGGFYIADRLRSNASLGTAIADAENSDADSFMTTVFNYGNSFSVMNGFGVGNDATRKLNTTSTQLAYAFRRAPGFMDVVAYTGNGVSGREIPHNLGVTPELAITKQRSGDSSTNWWNFYYPTGQVRTFNANAFSNWGITASETWFEGDPSLNNISTKPFIAYLFASCPGVSKVGTYTGTGANLDVDCGFSAGARFILIKRRDGTGDWYVWDSVRGIVSGNDPYLLLNSTAAEVTSTDYIDPLASGFTVTSSAPAALNASGGSYIFLAIA